ncbi:MAG: tRNA-(ms[2]io[6]A)-hydroxylase [Gammaproteobacteria bacterium]
MPRRSIDLMVATDPAWVDVIMENFDEFLCDHANCERKASALALSMVVKYPDRTRIIPPLIRIAQEELAHFRSVYELMEARGLKILADRQDAYVQQLVAILRHGREHRFLDRMLISSLIECRGAERFRLISERLEDPLLKRFYRDLAASEAKHGHLFVDLVLNYFPPSSVYPRLTELAANEARIIRQLQWRPALH